MRFLVVAAACLALASAGLYKETQDFQYSRTSSDDGEKKGYYGSQTGNMGGNFEVSHNMDQMAKGQMHQLIHTVNDQLGMEPGTIGSGRPIAGSIYGSASTSGNTFGAKKVSTGVPATSLNAQDLASGGSWSSQYDRKGSRATEGQYYGTNSQSQHSASGQRSQGNLYTGDGSVYRTDLQGGAAAANSRNVASTQQGSRWSSYGETGSQSANSRQNGERVYIVPTAGVRESGVDTASSGSQYSQQGTYRGSQAVNYGSESGASVVPLVVRPGSTVRLTVRPGQNVPIRIPISASQHGIQTSGQNTGYTTNSYDRRQSSADLTNTQRTHDMALLNAGTAGTVGAAGNVGSVGNAGNANGMKSYESSYSYQKEWESHGAPTESSDHRNTGVRTIGQVADFGAAAQNRDNLYVGGLEVAGEDNGGSTTYNSGSRVASTGQRYAGSNTYRESKGESSRNEYRSGSRQTAGQTYGTDSTTGQTYSAGSGHQAAGQAYNYGGASYNTAGQSYNSGSTRRGDEETYSTRNSHQTAGQAYDAESSQQGFRTVSQADGTNADRQHITLAANQPKSYGSSFSYKKSWEKHGDPYVIEPASVGTNSYGSSAGVQNADLSSMLNRESSGYVAGHRAGSTGYGSSSQYDSSRTAGLTSGGVSHTDDLSLSMAAMQDKLRSQMGQACGPTCNTGATKGYSSTYSYNAQRSYGGSDGMANNEGAHRYKRHIGVGFGHHDHHHGFQIPELPKFSSHSFTGSSGIQPKFSSHLGHGFHDGQSEIPVTSHSYSSSFSSGQGQTTGKGVLMVKLSPSFSGNHEDGGAMQKELEEKMKKELEEELRKEMDKHMAHSLSNEEQIGGTRRTYYSQTSRHYSTGKGGEFFTKQSGESDPTEETLTVSSGKLDMSGKRLEKPGNDKNVRTHGFTSTTYYSSNGFNGKSNKGEEFDLDAEAQGELEKSRHQTQGFSGSGKLLTSNKKFKDNTEDLEVDSGTSYRIHRFHHHGNKETTEPNKKNLGETMDEENEDFSIGGGVPLGSSHRSVTNKEISSSHFTTSSQHSSGKLIGSKNDDTDDQTQNLGQETQDFASAYTNSQGKPNLSSGRNPYLTTSDQYTSGKKLKSEDDNVGQETQGFSYTYGNLQAKPHLSSGSFHVTDDETKDMGQETQGFSGNLFSSPSGQYTSGKKPKTQVNEEVGQETQGFSGNLFLGSNSQYTSGKKPKLPENEDLGQETEDFSRTYGNLQARPHLSSGSFHVTDDETNDMGQETQGFSGNLFMESSSQYTSGKKPETPAYENDGQEIQDFVSAYGNLQAKPKVSTGKLEMTGQETQGFSGNLFSTSSSQYTSGTNPKIQDSEEVGQETQGFSGNLFLESGSQYTSGKKPKTPTNKDVGQETQDFTSTYGNLNAKPHFSSGSYHMTDDETNDMGQETQGFSGNLFSSPSSQYTSGKKPKTPEYEETQDFSSTYGNLQAKPTVSTGKLEMTGQETQGFSGNLFSTSSNQYTSGTKPKTQDSEEFGQETQGFSGNLFMGSNSQYTSGKKPKTPEYEDVGQETQGFSGNLFSSPNGQYTSGKKPKTPEYEDVGQETQGFSGNLFLGSDNQYTSGKKPKTPGYENVGQETQDFSSTYGNLQAKPKLSTGKLEMTGQETQSFSGNLFSTSSGQYTSGTNPKTLVNEDVGQETQGFSSAYGNLQSKPQFSTGNLHMTGQETEDLGQETQDFTSTYSNTQGKPHISTGNLQMTGQETQGFSGNLFLGSSGQYTSGKKPKSPGNVDVGQETQDFSSTYRNLQAKPHLSTGSLYMTGQETEDLGQQSEDLGQETQNFASSYGLTANSQHSAGKLLVGQETQDLGQQTQGFSQNFGSAYSSGSSRHSTGSLHMTEQETQDLGQQTYSFGHETSGFSNSGRSYSQTNTGTGPKLQQGSFGASSSQSSSINKQIGISKSDHVDDEDVDSHLDDLLALLGTDMAASIGKETQHTATVQTNKLDKNTPKYHFSSTDLSGKTKPVTGSGVFESMPNEPKHTPFNVNFTMEYQGGRANDRVILSNLSRPRENPAIHPSPALSVIKPTTLIATQGHHKPAETSFLGAHSGYYKVEGHQADQTNAGSGHVQKPVATVGNQKLNFAHESYDAGQQVEQTADWEGEQVAVQHAHVQHQYGQLNSGSLLENQNQDDFYQQSSYGAIQQKHDAAQHGLQAGHYQNAGRVNGQFAVGTQHQIYSQNAATPEKHVVTTTAKPQITTTEEPGLWRRAKDKAKTWFS